MYRFANSEGSLIQGEDGAFLPAVAGNADYDALIAAGAAIAPFQRFGDVEAARAAILAEIEAHAAHLRAAVAGTSDATKLAVYREKYETAARALDGDAAAIAALEPEAAARGETAAQLAALVVALRNAWVAAGLQIDAAYQTKKAEVAQLTLDQASAYDVRAGWAAG